MTLLLCRGSSGEEREGQGMATGEGFQRWEPRASFQAVTNPAHTQCHLKLLLGSRCICHQPGKHSSSAQAIAKPSRPRSASAIAGDRGARGCGEGAGGSSPVVEKGEPGDKRDREVPERETPLKRWCSWLSWGFSRELKCFYPLERVENMQIFAHENLGVLCLPKHKICKRQAQRGRLAQLSHLPRHVQTQPARHTPATSHAAAS